MLASERDKEKPAPGVRNRTFESELALRKVQEVRGGFETEASQPVIQVGTLERVTQVVRFGLSMKLRTGAATDDLELAVRGADCR
jgi:hypothetical protein